MADLEQPVLLGQLGVRRGQRLLFLPGGAGLVDEVAQRPQLRLLVGNRGFQAGQLRGRDLRRDTRQQIALTAGFGAQALHDLVE